MDRLLLGRYALEDALAVGLPVAAVDEVLARPVDVVLLPVGDGTPAAALQRIRAAIPGTPAGLPHVLDLAVVAGQPVAVLMSGAEPAQLAVLVARAGGPPETASGPPPTVSASPTARPGRRRRRAALLWAAGGAAVALGAVALLPLSGGPGGAGGPGGPGGPGASTSATAVPAPALPSGSGPVPSAPVPAGTPSLPPPTSPDERVVLLLAAVRDDPRAGVAARRLLSLLRGLDAATGEQRLDLARRTADFAREESLAGRLDSTYAEQTRDVMAEVLASG